MSTLSSVRTIKSILRGAVLLYLSAAVYCARADSASESAGQATPSSKHQITVVTMFKTNDAKPEEDLVFAGCGEWQLSAAGVAEYFSRAERLQPAETHSYNWFPCHYQGTLLMDGTPFEFKINAGLTGWLENQETTERELVDYGCKKACATLSPFGDLYEDGE